MWKTVRVFISSTFKDMHAERDYLVRFVFPRLREELLKRRIHLVDVDLRWGVTADQDSFEACMDEIERCHPRFICILGGRYGWIPAPKIVPMEFMTKVLNGTSSAGVISEKNAKVLEDLYVPDQAMGIYRLCEKPREKEQTKNWYSNGEIAVEIFQRAELPEAMLSITASEVHFGALDRLNEPAFRYFYFRKPAVTKSIPNLYADIYQETENSLKEQMLETLKERIKNPKTLGKTLNEEGIEELESLPFFEYPCKLDEETQRIIELKEFGDRVYADLLSSIDAEFGTSIPEKLSDFDEENAMMESFIEERTERYVVGSRKEIFEELQKHSESTYGNGYLCLVGDPGSGKSALLAKFYRDYTDYQLNPNHANHIVIPHFVGISAGSTDIRKTLRRICHELKKSGIDDEIPEDYEELRKVFPVFLKKAAERSHVVIIIDAVNQFDMSNQALNMLWLPAELPEGVRVILSTLPGPSLDALKKRSNPVEKTLSLLKNSDANDIISEFLKRYRKNLEPEQRLALLDKEDSKTPLYLLIALEEIRTLGIYEEITARIQELPGKVQPLFLEVLKRLENDDGFRDREGNKIGNELVRNFVSFIGVSRHGLSQSELVELIALGDPLGNVAALQRLLRPYLMQRGELLDFYHNQLREAVNGKYLADEEECLELHKQLAIYFYSKADPLGDKSWNGNYSRGLSELPYHQTHAKMIGELENTLTDLMFIEAKFTVGMGYDLLADYNRVSTRNRAGFPIITAKYYEGKFGVFCPFCLGWSKVEKSLLGKDMECPECKKRLVLNSFTINAEWQPSKGERKTEGKVNVEPLMSKAFIDYYDFAFGDHHILLEHPNLTIQQALNQPYESEVAIKAKTFDYRKPWIRWINKPQKKSLCLMKLVGHTDFVNACSFSPDGKIIVSASHDLTLRIWDTETGEEIKVLRGHARNVNDCRFSPNGKIIVSASDDLTLRIWDAETGEEIKVLRGHTDSVNACSFSPDGKKIVSASSDLTLRIWDAKTGTEIKVLNGHTAAVRACCFSPDGKRIVSAAPWGEKAGESLRIWDAETGEEVKVLNGHTESVNACCFSPDGKRIVSPEYKSLRIWDAHTGEEIMVLKHTTSMNDCSFSPDGKRIISASYDYTLRIWDAQTGEEIIVLKHTDYLRDCSFSPDGKKIVSASKDKTLQIWDAETGTGIKVLNGHTISVNDYCFSPDGKRIVSASGDETLRIWDSETGEEIKVLRGHTSFVLTCCFSPDGKRILSAARDDRTLRIWDAETGEEIKVFNGHTSSVIACCFTPDGKRIVSASYDNTLRIWDAETGEEIKALNGHTDFVKACSLSPDGKRIVSASGDRTLRIWDVETGEEIKVLNGHNICVNDCSFSPDGKRIVSASGDETLRIWDAETGEEIIVLKHTDYVTSCSFSPDGKRIVSTALYDNTLRIWDAETGEEIKVLNGHTDHLNACSFSHDGKRIVSASRDKTLRIWDAITGSCISIFFALGSLNCFDMANGQMKIVSGDKGGNVYLLLVNGLNSGLPFVTPVRLYLYDVHEWDNKLTARCKLCGNLFVIEQKIIDMLNSLNNNLGKVISDHKVILGEALNDPRLNTTCPHCNNKLRLTPFVVDNTERHIGQKNYRDNMENSPLISKDPINIKYSGNMLTIADSDEQNYINKRSEDFKYRHKDSVKRTSELLNKEDLTSLRLGEIKTKDEPTKEKVEDIPKLKKPWWKFWK
ncbi:DUF4062 domain-containing protein [Methanosarcina sp. 1.H.T.1A.1]|uniref:DUF4062 domain-containing protein n=1 Tax=Methanosarcina sp. 1.H.T.1A.1 TaxID=1483602 RepID=UPI0022858322|nr:DUF4062 domain-containing protein [Methanosarcina sp. 1.H.T.1A.1]